MGDVLRKMRILTWNVVRVPVRQCLLLKVQNVLRTCLDYHPFSSMKKRNVEGLLDELGAEIFCFQGEQSVQARASS